MCGMQGKKRTQEPLSGFVYSHFLSHILSMPTDGALAQLESLRNLRITLPLLQKPGNTQFLGGEIRKLHLQRSQILFRYAGPN